MLDLLGDLGTTIQDFIVSVGYPGVIFVMFMEYVFPPIPSELVLPFAGFQVAEGKFDLVTIWLASIVGSMLGSLLLYYIGLWVGDHVVRQFLQRYGRWVMLSENDYNRTLDFFTKYGDVIVFTGRLIPIVRSLVSIPAGADHMPLPKFMGYTFLGSAIWNGVLIGAGWQLGENWENVMNLVEQYQKVVIVVIALALLWFGGRFIWGRWRATPAEDPTPAVPES